MEGRETEHFDTERPLPVGKIGKYVTAFRIRDSTERLAVTDGR
jgi:hypothetical protein